MTSQITLLHCLRQRTYLEAALRDGFMLTDHKVTLEFTKDNETLGRELLKPLIPFIPQPDLRKKVEDIVLSNMVPQGDLELNKLLMGIGAVGVAAVPMLCFTEVVGDGRDLNRHVQAFGRYAVAVRREWVIASGGDRVIYVGEGQAATMHLARLLGALRLLSSLGASKPGQFLFDTKVLALVFELACFVEIVAHLEEFEWRIVGRTGLSGGEKETGKKIVCPLKDILRVYVNSVNDVPEIEKIIQNKAVSEGYTGKFPPVDTIDKILG